MNLNQKSILRMGWIAVLMILAGMVIFHVQPVQAAAIDDDGVLPAGETIHDDLLISADNVIIDGTVNGAVIAAGNRVVVNGTVNGDLLMFASEAILSESAKVTGNVFSGARNIEIRGKVSGSVFGGSSVLTISNNAVIGRNLYYGGNSLESMAGSQINIDVFAGVYQAILNGEIKRNLTAGAAAVELNGAVGGNVTLDVASPTAEDMGTWFFNFQPGMPPAVAPGLRVSPQAVIGGDLKYTSPVDQANAIQSRPEGEVIYQTPAPGETIRHPVSQPQSGVFDLPLVKTLVNMLRNLITLLLLGGLVLWLLPELFRRTVDQARGQTLASAGVGLFTLLGGYIGSVLAAFFLLGIGLFLSLITLGGLSRGVFGIGFSGLALLVAVFTLLVFYGSKLVVSYWIGELLVRQIAPNTANPRLWALLSGVLIYVILRAIPILGWLVAFIATLIGLGAIWFAVQSYRKPKSIPAEAVNA